jgi:TolA-binding protein
MPHKRDNSEKEKDVKEDSVLNYIKKKLDEISLKQDETTTKLDTMNKSINDLNERISYQDREIEDLKDENQRLKSLVGELSKNVDEKLDDTERYSKLTNIEIIGVPEKKSEEPTYIVKQLATAIGRPLQEIELEAAHRVPTRGKGPRPIIAKFISRKTKEEVIVAARRARKSTSGLTAQRIDPTLPSVEIYVNEHLTDRNKKFIVHARKLIKQKTIKHVWTAGGFVYVRKGDDTKPIRITRIEEFNNV